MTILSVKRRRWGWQRAYAGQKCLAFLDTCECAVFPPETQPSFSCSPVSRLKSRKCDRVDRRKNGGPLGGNEQAVGSGTDLIEGVADPIESDGQMHGTPAFLTLQTLHPCPKLLTAGCPRTLRSRAWLCCCDRNAHTLLSSFFSAFRDDPPLFILFSTYQNGTPTRCATSYTSQAKWLQMVLCCIQGFGAEVALLLGRQKISGEERQVLWEVDTRSPPS